MFSVFINLIEAFIFPIFISEYFDLSNKKMFITVSGITQFLLLSLFEYYNNSSYLLTLLIISVNVLFIYCVNKKITFNNILVVVIYNFIILVSTITGVYIETFFKNFCIWNDNFVMAIIIGKIILIGITYMIIHLKWNMSVSFKLKGWRFVLWFEIILLGTIAWVGYLIVSLKQKATELYFLLLFLVILNFAFFFVIYNLNKLNKENLVYQKEAQKNKFDFDKMITIKNIKNDIDAIDHRLFYIVMEIDNLLARNEVKKARDLINNYKTVILKHKMIIDTGNSIFDCLLSLKINDLIIKDIDVKTCIFIPQNELYNNFNLINFINNTLNFFYECHHIEIFLKEINGFLQLTILQKSEYFEILKLTDFLDKEIKNINGYYNLERFETEGLKLVIKIGEEV